MKKTFKIKIIIGMLIMFLQLMIYTCISFDPSTRSLEDFVEEHLIKATTPNGTTYYVIDQKFDKIKDENNTLQIGLLVKAGSVLERDDQLGLAHFVEHMAFNGTERFPKNTLDSELGKIGVRIGNDLNAYTGFDRTVFFMTIPNTPENLELGLDVLLEWSHKLSYDQDAIDKEKPVVLEEVRAMQNKQAKLYRENLSFFFGDSLYAERFPGGKMDVIETAPREVIKQFYDDWYKPNLMAVYVIGDIDTTHTIASINERFSYQDSVAKLPEIKIPLGIPNTMQLKRVFDETLSNEVVFNYWLPNKAVTSVEELLDSILMRWGINIINQQLEALIKNGIISSAYATKYDALMGYERFNISVGLIESKYLEGLQAVWQVLASIVNTGVNQELIDKQIQVMEEWLSEQDKDDIRYFFDDIIEEFMSNTPILYLDNRFTWLLDIMKTQATPERLNPMIKSLFNQSELRLLASAKREEILPSEEAIFNLYEDTSFSTQVLLESSNTYLESLLDEEELEHISQLHANKQKKQSIKQKKHPLNKKGYKFQLENGINVEYFRKQDAEDLVRIDIHGLGGIYDLVKDYSTSELVIANNLSKITDMSRMGKHSGLDIARYFSDHGMYANINIQETGQIMSIRGLESDLESLFQFGYLLFTGLQYDARQRDVIISHYNDNISSIQNNPEHHMFIRYMALLHNENPFVQSMYSDLDYKLSEADIMRGVEMYKSMVKVPQNFTFTITANIPVRKIRTFVQKYIGILPYGTAQNKEVHPVSYSTKGVQVEETFPNTKQTLVSFSWMKELEPSKLSSRDMILNYYLETLINILLSDEIREEEGGVYYIYPVINYGPINENPYNAVGKLLDRYSELRISFGSEPSRAIELRDKSIALVQGILDDAVGAGVKDREELIARVEASVERGIDEEEYYYVFDFFWEVYMRQNYFHKDNIKEELKAIFHEITFSEVQVRLKSMIHNAEFFSLIQNPEGDAIAE